MTKAIDLLADFIKRSDKFHSNEWLSGDDMHVYVRKATRFINQKRCITLDIANVTVFKKGKGQFTRFLRLAHELNPWDFTYVESVLEPRLHKFLQKEGFLYKEHSVPASYFKAKK